MMNMYSGKRKTGGLAQISQQIQQNTGIDTTGVADYQPATGLDLASQAGCEQASQPHPAGSHGIDQARPSLNLP